MRHPARSPSARPPRASPVLAAAGAVLASLALLAGSGDGVQAENVILRVQQGTDISVTPGSEGQLITDLAGRLWSLPAAGGAATPLSEPGEFARRPRLSPDGNTVAYESLRDGALQLMLMDISGGLRRQLTSGPSQHRSPAWSADGRRLALASDRGGDFSIWELDLESGSLRQLSFEPGHEFDPAWNPADAAIAYISEQEGRSALVVRSPGRPPRTLASSERPLRAPAWRPDGSVISFVAALPEGPRLRMAILSDPVVIKPVGGAEAAFPAPATWLDRNHLLYTADGQIRSREIGALGGTVVPFEATLALDSIGAPPGRVVPMPGGAQPARGLAGIAVLPDGRVVASALGDLWEFGAQGALLRQLTLDAFVDRDPAVSADGRRLAFTSDRDGTPQLWLMDLGSRDSRRLTAEPGFAAHPAWNAAGDQVAYLAGEDDGNRRLALKIVAVDDGAVTQVASDLVQPGTPAWSPDATQIATVQTRQGNPQLLLFAAADGATRRLTLPREVVGPGANEVQWSADGKRLLVASAAGLYALPVLDSGLVSAEWSTVTSTGVQIARWIPGQDAVMFTDGSGLARVGASVGASVGGSAGGDITRIVLAIDWRPAGSVTPAGRTVIQASRIFDGSASAYLLDHEIVIDGARISAVRPWSGDHAGATVVDARGKTVMPGLIDLAIELTDRAGERLGRTLLAYGITTAQVTSNGAELAEVAERWQARAAGPRLLRSPEWCGAGALLPATTTGLTQGGLRLCPAATGQLPLLADTLRNAGASVWSPDWINALSGLVHVVSPALAPASASGLEAGPAGTVHYQDAIDVLARSGVVFIPALAARGLPFLVQQQPDLVDNPQYRSLYRDEERAAHARAWEAAASRDGSYARSGLRMRQRALGRLMAGGGRLATASLAPTVPYGLGLHAELRLLAGIGLAPAQVLGMATAEAARALGLQDELGRLAPGRLADLLVVDGDPLRDLAQVLRIEAVMTNGILRPMDTLVPATPAPLEKFTSPRPQRGAKPAPSLR